MARKRKSDKNLPEEKKVILELLDKIKSGTVPINESHAVWDKIYSYKKVYIKNINSQSWNSFIGGVFEDLVYYILTNYITKLSQKEEFKNIKLFTEDEIQKNDYLHQKLSIKYGPKERLLPDTDMAVVDFNKREPHMSQIVAIISCKTSLKKESHKPATGNSNCATRQQQAMYKCILQLLTTTKSLSQRRMVTETETESLPNLSWMGFTF